SAAWAPLTVCIDWSDVGLRTCIQECISLLPRMRKWMLTVEQRREKWIKKQERRCVYERREEFPLRLVSERPPPPSSPHRGRCQEHLWAQLANKRPGLLLGAGRAL
ncbi:hypothetical protein KUCAC02_025667, partial [Chaenocephalus aceratus]